MEWYALQVRHDEKVVADLSRLDLAVHRLMYTVEFFHPRKSVVVVREHPLLPGVLLINVDVLPPTATRHWHRFMTDHVSGRPLRVPEAESLMRRAADGEFDVVLHQMSPFEAGARVYVEFLGLMGRVVECARGVCRVLLDTGHTVRCGQGALAAV